MAEKVTITRIFKDEVASKFKPGHTAIRTTIYTSEYPDLRMTCFKDLPWSEGDVVMITKVQKGNFTNFSPAAEESQLEARVKRLEDKVFGATVAPVEAKTAPRSVDKEEDDSGIDW